jgi:chromosome segregation ATPase
MEVVMARNKKRKRLPSEERYDQSHPTVSFRLPAELYNRLKDHLRGQSFAAFVISHLTDEEAQINARVEELARQRNNLGAEILNRQRQLRDLDEQVKKRKQELAKPFEEERARLRAEIDGWYRQEKSRFEYTRAYNETRLETLRSQVRQEKEQLRKVKMDLVFAETRHKALEQQSQKWLEERETWVKRMQQATEFINTYPWFFCHQCPGAAFNQLLGQMMNTVSSLQAKEGGATAVPQLNETQGNG